MDRVLSSVAIGLGVFFLLHVLIWRARPSNAPRIVRLTGLAVMGMVVAGWMAVGVNRLPWIDACAVLWLTGFWSTLYFFIYAGLARSVSVTLLSRLLPHRAESVEFDTLLEEYVASRRFDDRIRLMHDTGLLRLEEESVSLTPVGRALSRGAQRLTRLLGGALEG
ncbi:MAG: hypothetical protein HY595_03350 [Candidatus Omnitrophica bacterium]|nr:hypothetical protein [Candidatus Omnitrophota bacterium]